ncbi:MAG: hypothetical protein HY791_11900 [Deltaproteobacteria bacterium]|nr:hypothetical protein [Deltaproteobacteria bacterium]
MDGVFDGGFGEFAIEPGFALFVRAKLDKATMRIKYLNCQALVTPGKELIDFYRCDQVDAHYYRLDYDPSILGPFCAEPIPHLHVRMHGPPRAWVRDPNYLVQEFVEWVYLNYFHDIWTHWAGRTWEEYRRKQGIREEDDVFKTILSAFEEGQIDFVTENQTQLKQIRNAIRTARDRLFPYYCDPAHGELINY